MARYEDWRALNSTHKSSLVIDLFLSGLKCVYILGSRANKKYRSTLCTPLHPLTYNPAVFWWPSWQKYHTLCAINIYLASWHYLNCTSQSWNQWTLIYTIDDDGSALRMFNYLQWQLHCSVKCLITDHYPYTLYLMTTCITKWVLSSIKKAVILYKLYLMPPATCLVICINNLWAPLLSACITPVPTDCRITLSISSNLKNNPHALKRNTDWEPVFQLSFLSYRQECLSLVSHRCLFQNHWSLHSASPSVKATNMHVILSGQSFNVIVNSPESALMKLVSSQEPQLISPELSFSLHWFIVSNSCWIGLKPTASPNQATYSNGRFHLILS